MLAEGWRIERIAVDWGKYRSSLSPEMRDRWIREMTHAADRAQVHTTWSGKGIGRTTVELAKPLRWKQGNAPTLAAVLMSTQDHDQ